MNKAIALVLLLQLNSCAVTVHRWSETSDLERIKQAPDSERIVHYQNYAIHDWQYVFLGSPYVFSTVADADTHYAFGTFVPTLLNVYPEAQTTYQDIQFYEQAQTMSLYTYATLMLGTVIFLGANYLLKNGASEQPDAQSKQAFDQIFQPLLIGTSGLWAASEIYLEFQKDRAYQSLKTGYNEALRKYLDLSPDSLSQAIPEPTLAVK